MRATFNDRWSRRSFLGACAALTAAVHGRAAELSEDGRGLDARVLHLDGESKLARSALVLMPRVCAKTPPSSTRPGAVCGALTTNTNRDDAGSAPTRFPVLVLLHGLGETHSEALGLHAWSERYGLIESDARLRHPPVTCKNPKRYLPAERAARIAKDLAARPYEGFIVACPVTPNVYALPSRVAALDRYAAWIVDTLLPAVHASTPSRTDASGTAIDGCSLGGYVALETFVRRPEAFGVLGGVQAAIGEATAKAHAERVAAAISRVGPRRVHIESSLWDPSLKAHRLMSKRLHELGIANDLDVLPGGHDQIFLREIGTLEMLLWHDRALRSGRGERTIPT